MVISKQSTGLILKESFDTLGGWVSTGGWQSVAASHLTSFNPSDIPCMSGRSINGTTAGAREGQIIILAGVWYLIHDSGDGYNGWREFLAKSTDRGLSWNNLGATPEGVSKIGGGAWAAVANGWVERRGGTVYRHRVVAQNSFAFPNVGLPGGPYYWDTWSASSIEGPWTAIRNIATEVGTWAANQKLPSCTVFDGSTYHHFAQGEGGSGYCVGRTTSNDPDGDFTTAGAQIAGPSTTGFYGRQCENCKVFYSDHLGKWVMLVNLINTGGTFTDANAFLTSSSLTDWSGATGVIFQKVCPIDNGNLAIGVSCHITTDDGELVSGINGKIPFVFDGQPSMYSSAGSHLGRKIFYSVLEPSTHVARVSTAGDNTDSISRSISHSDFSAEFAMRFTSGTSVAFFFRQDGSGNGYRITITKGSGLSLQKTVAGVTTTVSSGSGSQTADIYSPTRIKVTATGTSIKAWLDGEIQINSTDTSFSSGAEIRLSAKAAVADLWLLSMRNSDSLTISGMAPGSSAIIRGAGGVPYAAAIANDNGQATATLPHWPHDEIEINGVSYNGEIWGGDSFSVSSPAKFRGRVNL